ncbi:ATP-binding protein Wzt of ABC-transporter involved in LPS [Candidatus Vecturithrix granuli]|uniref:ATP-binding protein Wzt of ABC-transporter involved in LPS n=1 Tax=Vecturithrix granuli TaxID=1499967 RepID=A0A0S6WAI4_VECG1|nr:ATP-binding protein Wzt of ABC-transporter involved in LPS [Candidatus Vecturithrix granuli]
MGDIAISVENLGKRYRIGHAAKRPENLREAFYSLIAAPFQYLHSRLREPSGDELFWALKDVSFEVKHGEVLGIIGRNGAGKSTLLKILSRITEPTTGCAKVYGRVGSLLEVGTGFHPELTGRENIYLNGTILGMKRTEIDKKFDEIVDFSGIEKFLDTPVKRYSSGMYVRLAFAVAAHLEPEILLVDEVLAVGDAEFQKRCLCKMDTIAQEGRTVLFVSHAMQTIQALCSKGIVLHDGTIIFHGTSDEAIEEHLTLAASNLQKRNSLENRQDRRGTQIVRLVNVRFIDGNTRQEREFLISGKPVLIEISYTSSHPQEVKHFDIGIAFYTTMQSFLFACRSSSVGVDFSQLQHEGKLYCWVPKWPLNKGSYTYNLYSEANGGVSCDWIQNAGRIDVEAGDFYNTGKLPASSMQGVFIDYTWQEGL